MAMHRRTVPRCTSKKEPAVTYAAAAMDPCIAHCNLSAAIDHYGTHNNLCSTIENSLETCGNLSAAADLQLIQYKYYKKYSIL